MTAVSRQLPVLNSLLFIRDVNSQETPAIDGLSNIWMTSSCVAVGCLPDCDGDTSIKLGSATEVGLPKQPAFDGQLLTPSRKIAIDGVLEENLLQINVSGIVTRLRIWTDGHRASNYVFVGVD